MRIILLLLVSGILLSCTSPPQRKTIEEPTCAVSVRQKLIEAAQKACLREAENGDSSAQAYLSMMYADGVGFARDDQEAMKWLKKSAENGYGEAQYELGLRYLKGDGVEKNSNQALSYLDKAAQANNRDAQLVLGQIYLQGKLVSQDTSKGMQLIRKAAEQDEPRAKEFLQKLNTPSSPKDLQEIYKIGFFALQAGDGVAAEAAFRKLLDIKPNSYDLNVYLGIALGLQKKYDESITILEKAVLLDPHRFEAYQNLGYSIAQTGDFDRAIEIYNKSLQIKPDDQRTKINLQNAQRGIKQ